MMQNKMFLLNVNISVDRKRDDETIEKTAKLLKPILTT